MLKSVQDKHVLVVFNLLKVKVYTCVVYFIQQHLLASVYKNIIQKPVRLVLNWYVKCVSQW